METHNINGEDHVLNPFTRNPWKPGEWENFDFDRYYKLRSLDQQEKAPEPKVITRLAMLNRITDQEAVAIDLASIGSTEQAASIRRFMSKVNAAQFVDLNDPDTINGVQFLVSQGLLTAERGDEILTNPVQPKERP